MTSAETTNINQFLWVEKYRPTKVDDCILPDSIKKPFLDYAKRKEVPNFILAGGAGMGKTTIAKALCNEVGCDWLLINGSDERGIDVLRTKIKNYASSMSISGGRKVIIVDEADYLTPELQAGLRAAIEEFAANCSFIFTCNFPKRLIDALPSRCPIVEFKFSKEDRAKMAMCFLKRLEKILTNEKVTYDKKVLVEVISKYFPDFRRIIGEVQRYSGSGELSLEVLSSLNEVTLKDLVKHLRNKDFSAMRKWVGLNIDNDSQRIFRRIYESLYDYMKPESIPQAVVILADYQYKAAFVADQELNLVACLTEIMSNCDFQ